MAEQQRGIDRFFAALTALYGAQKVAGMWSGADMPAVKALWSAQLSRLTREAIEAGLQRCVDDGLAWPPTLPEFVALCKPRTIEAAHRPAALPAPVSREHAAANLVRVQDAIESIERNGDALAWARRPRSIAAVRRMAEGAQRHPYLARILQGHFAANGVDCQTPEATQALLCIRERMLERVPGEDDE